MKSQEIHFAFSVSIFGALVMFGHNATTLCHGGLDALRKRLFTVIIDEISKTRKTPFLVIPAKAGIYLFRQVLDSGFRRSGGLWDFFPETDTMGN
jgi:hypothetical protein